MIKRTGSVAEVRQQVKEWKKQGLTVGLVPTMGYLHEGHKSLIDRAVKENDRVVVSIFVNPIQFAPNEDLESYPRDIEKDTELCTNAGASLIFNPTPEEMYPNGFSTNVVMNNLTKELCGKTRPTHFGGVCTVVSKLFNIVAPDRAYFGEKDAQQLAIIKRMVSFVRQTALQKAQETLTFPQRKDRQLWFSARVLLSARKWLRTANATPRL